MKISIIIPEHSRPLRLMQVVRNIRETSRFHHEIVVVGDRLDMGIMYDYDPELVDEDLVSYIEENKLSRFPSYTGDFNVEDCLKKSDFFSMRKWFQYRSEYLEPYDITLKECPLDYKIEEKFAVHHNCLPKNKSLRDLKEWDFGADIVVNWIMEESDFKNQYVLVTDDDMLFLKDWDYELLKHVGEDEEYDYVYTPKVYNVVKRSRELGLYRTLGAFEFRVPKKTVYLDTSLVKRISDQVNKDEHKDFTIEVCGRRGDGPALPMLIHRRLWRNVGGRDYLISDEQDGTFPGRFIGGTEVHFDDKLGEYGIQKKVCWKSICIHSKLPLKYRD